ncbi:MAG TPA: GNAT family N-acetyltransferase [Baekduia sp.]
MLALRAAAGGDVDAVMALWLRAAENAGRPADRREMVEALVARDPGALIVAEVGGGGGGVGVVVGSVIAGWDGWRFHLYRLAVDPEWRRSGVGRALLEAAEARFRELGATRVDAMVLDANALGQEIWGATGYRRQADWRRWVKAL